MLKRIQDKHSKDMADVRQAWVLELRSLSNRLTEKTEASSALSCELKETRRQSEVRESKLRSLMSEEISRMERIVHQEKVQHRAMFLSAQRANITNYTVS